MAGDLHKNTAERLAHIEAMRDQFGFDDREIMKELRDELSVLDDKNAAILSTASILFVGYTIILGIGQDRLQERGVLGGSILLLFLFIIFLGRQILRIARVRWSRYDRRQPTDEYFDELLAARNARTRALRSTYWVMTLLSGGLLMIYSMALVSSLDGFLTFIETVRSILPS